MATIDLPSLEATERLAAALATQLRDGDVVELHGDLGAGKTTLVGAVARALGSVEPARSPTYTIAHAYELAGGRRMAHLDCYRQVGSVLDDAAWGDLEPYFDDAVALVEWPEPIRPWLTDRPTWIVQLHVIDLERRSASITAPRDRSDAVEVLARAAAGQAQTG